MLSRIASFFPISCLDLLSLMAEVAELEVGHLARALAVPMLVIVVTVWSNLSCWEKLAVAIG